jgi:hypothetical protein
LNTNAHAEAQHGKELDFDASVAETQSEALPPTPPPDDTVSQALTVLDKLHQDVATVPNLDVLNAITAKAIGLQRLYGGVKQVADRAGEVWIFAERRLGEELRRMNKAVGTRGQFRGRDASGRAVIAPLDERQRAHLARNNVTLAEIGLKGDPGKRRSVQAQRLAAKDDAEIRDKIEALKAEGKGVTPAAVLKEAPREPDRPADLAERARRALDKLDRNVEIALIAERLKLKNISFPELRQCMNQTPTP